ncbi:MAG: 50S ribosomal protein L5 [bacterium]
MPRLKEKYKKEVIPAMREKFGYGNDMAVPKIEKVVVNTGFGRLVADKTKDEQAKIHDSILQDLAAICGQKPILRKSKKSIAAFKTREGMEIGASCTLRKKRMYDLLERLIDIALPRTRDFQGIDQKAVDRQGNLTVGIKEHSVFPEILPEKMKAVFGLEITAVTNAKNGEEGLELFKLMGFPIKK